MAEVAVAGESKVEQARRRQRSTIVVRWAGVAFGLSQVTTYDAAAYPAGAQALAYGLVLAMGLLNAVTLVLHRRLDEEAHLDWLAAVALAADVIIVSAVVWVYAFDPLSAIFVVLILLPIEGAMHFGLRGASWTWGAVSALYLVREWLGTRFGDPWSWTSVSFRVGVIGIVALIVGRLVQDLVRQREATMAALDEARRADAWRARLVSMLAHDVRAPLAAVRSGLGLLRSQGDRLSDEQRRDVELASLRQTDRALLLARDLLDMARSESGVLEVQAAALELRPFVEEVATLAGVAGSLEMDLPDGIYVHADRDRLEQVLHNLLHNAERYGAAPFVVSARSVDAGVELVVRDHGPGVPPELDLFAPFAGGGGSGSVGLGIWTARALTDAHGGTIRHENAQPGAAFVLWFPDGPDMGRQAPAVTARATR